MNISTFIILSCLSWLHDSAVQYVKKQQLQKTVQGTFEKLQQLKKQRQSFVMLGFTYSRPQLVQDSVFSRKILLKQEESIKIFEVPLIVRARGGVMCLACLVSLAN